VILGSSIFNGILTRRELNNPTLQAGCSQHRDTMLKAKQQYERPVVRKQ